MIKKPVRSSKKNKWKQREERRLKRLNRSRDSGTSKPRGQNEERSKTVTVHCSNSHSKTKPETSKELITKSRLTLKPFGRNKIHDAMSWPTIKMPDSVAPAIEDGVKKMTREARKIRNSNNVAIFEFRPDTSTGAGISRSPTCIVKEKYSIDVNRIKSSSDNISEHLSANESSTFQIAASENIVKNKYVKIAKQEPRSFAYARAWLDTARKPPVSAVDSSHHIYEAVATPKPVVTEQKSVGENGEALLLFIAQYHHTGKSMWQGLKCAKEHSGLIKATKAKLIGLLAEYEHEDLVTVHSKQSSQELYWTASENPFNGMEDSGSWYTKASLNSIRSVPFEIAPASIKFSSPSVKTGWLQISEEATEASASHHISLEGPQHAESSEGFLSCASHDILEVDYINMFSTPKKNHHSLNNHQQKSPSSKCAFPIGSYGNCVNRLPCSDEYVWSFDKGWLSRSKRSISNCTTMSLLSPTTNVGLHGEWPFISGSVRQDSNNHYRDLVDKPPLCIASPTIRTDCFSNILESTSDIRMESCHQQRRHDYCYKDTHLLDATCKNISPYKPTVFDKPFFL